MQTIFIHGCNLACPYCINRELVIGEQEQFLDAEKIASELFISGERWIMISGGEALRNKKTLNLMARLKDMYIQVALATNGTQHKALEFAVENDLVSHVAMDIKVPFSPGRYSDVGGVDIHDRVVSRVEKSMNLLIQSQREGKITCEFRTTVCNKFLNKEDLIEIAKTIGKDAAYVLQPFTTHQTLDPSMADEKYVVPYETLVEWSEDIRPYVRDIFVRDV